MISRSDRENPVSPELETLDQLLGGDLPLAVIRTVYPDDGGFVRGMAGLLAGGDIPLLADGVEVPSWRWREVLFGDLARCFVR
jgi:hypothetical protein